VSRGDTDPAARTGGSSEAETFVSTPSAIQIDERVALERTAQKLLGRRNWVRVGRYEVVQNIGRGACGLVLGATDPELDRKVAIKLVLPSRERRGEGERWQARLLREAQTLAQLRHPNIVEVFDVGEQDGGVYLVMQWLQGRTLRQWLADERPSWEAIVAVHAAAGRALDAAHRRGLVHRDFKPDNVMVDSSSDPAQSGVAGQVKVIDFGLTRAAASSQSDSASGISGDHVDEGLTRADTVLGTPAYMAPEQHAGKPSGAPADQFAYCVSLYESLWGKRPFEGPTLHALHEAKIRNAIDPPPRDASTPRWLWPIVRRGLSRAPADRWPSMAALLEALQRRRSSRPVWIAAGTVVVVAGAAVWMLVPGEASQLCEDLERRRHEVWNAARAASVHDRLASTQVPFAPDTASRVQSRLDAYVQRW
jgi:serine/threonine protein kinase